MILVDHNGCSFPVCEEKGKLITAITAFMFDNGIIYHIGHENGDVDVFPVLSGTEGRYLGNEVFLLPDIRTSFTTIDFQRVTLTEYGYLGLVDVADKTISLPQYTVAQDFDTAMRSTYADLASPPEVPRPEFIPSGTPDDTYGCIMMEDPLVGVIAPVTGNVPLRRVVDINLPTDNPVPEETPEEEPMPF